MNDNEIVDHIESNPLSATLDYLIRDARRNHFIFTKFLCVAPFPPVLFVFFSEKVLCVGNWILSHLSFFGHFWPHSLSNQALAVKIQLISNYYLFTTR